MSSFTRPSTMRAWTYTSRGAPRDVLSLQSAHPMPPPPSGVDLLVRVSHVALNPAGEVRMSLIPSVFGRPFIPELDFCGWVQQAGPAAPSFLAEGTAVWGSLSPKATMSGAGTLAEYLVVPADRVVTKPTQIDFAEASGLSTVGQTAIKMVQTAGVKRGDRVLVNGASGGVGTVLVQIAKAAGVEVVATCSEPNIAMLKGLGADEVIDYRATHPLYIHLTQMFSQRPFDAILDAVGTMSLFDHSPAYLKPEGLYVNVGAFEGKLYTLWCWLKNAWWPRILGGTPRKFIMFSTQQSRENAEELARLVKEGKLKVPIDSIFDMKDALLAYDRISSHRAKGKVIVKIQDV